MKVKNYLSRNNLFQLLEDKGMTFDVATAKELNTAFLYRYGNFDVIDEETSIEDFSSIVYITYHDLWNEYKSALSDLGYSTKSGNRTVEEKRDGTSKDSITSSSKVFGFDSNTGVDKESEDRMLDNTNTNNVNRSISYKESSGLPIDNISKTIKGKKKLNFIDNILQDVADLLVMPYCAAE